MAIIFLSDWKYYPTAIVDTKTRNQSFVRMASLYKQMGIENYYFHLALIQPELQGVDPYDENLDLETKAKILYECDHNPWYFIREIIRIKNAGITDEDKMYKAHRGNIAALWLMLACYDYIQIQIRQTGKSFGTDVNSIWLLRFKYRDTIMNLITKDETLRKNNIARLKNIIDELPSYINRGTRKDDNNQSTMSCIALNNRLHTHVSQSSEKAANNLGRGMTTPYMHIDEGPFINHIETTVSAAMGSMVTARENAERMNLPHCAVFTTTAGKKDDRDGNYMYELMSGATVWNEIYFDSRDREDLREKAARNRHGRSDIMNMTLSHRQVGKTDEWLYQKIAAAKSEGENIDRDYFNVWTSGSRGSIVPPDVAERIRGSEMDPVHREISKDNYIFRWYEVYDPNAKYVLAVDTSDAIGRDDIALLLVRVTDGGVAGAAAINDTNIIRFASWLKDFLIQYKNIVIIPERRHNGPTIIDYLLIKLSEAGEDPFKRIYNKLVQERTSREKEYSRILNSVHTRPEMVYNRHREDFGFVTSGTSRKLLYGTVFSNSTAEVGHLMHDSQLIQQTLGLVERNGRIDHQASGHDDMVISWLFTQWLLVYGLNLDHYGIDSTKVMSNKRTTGMSMEDAAAQEEQNHIMSEIESVHNRLKNTNNRFEIIRLEAELNMLLPKLSSGGDSSLTIDGLIKDAELHRSRRIGVAGSGNGRTGRMVNALLRK